MLDRETVHAALGISEAYELPSALLGALLDETRRDEILATFLGMCDDLEHDSFTSYFQDEQGDRDALKQDFTPPELCDLVAYCAGDHASYIDVCAGTGGLTISAWAAHRDAFFRCEEYSSRTVPVLLLNLAMRNISAEVIRRDVLTGETFAAYSLTPGKQFAIIKEIDEIPERRFGACIQNPPYSLKYDGERRDWHRYGTPPKSKADYAFVQYGLANVTARGRVVCVLPHGVLFRGQGEGAIRTALIDDGTIDTVIGLPDKLFRHTGIPVCILSLQAGDTFGHASDSGGNIYFIDASKEFEKVGKLNVMRTEHMERVRSALTLRAEIDKFAHLATYDEIVANDYNLNIPRYVDTYETEPLPELGELFAELRDIDAKIHETERSIAGMMSRLRFTDDEEAASDGPMLENIIRLLGVDGGEV